MKITKYTIILLLALTIIFNTLCQIDTHKRILLCQEQINSLEFDFEPLENKIDNLEIDDLLVDKIEELTRDNVRLRNENADMKNQIVEFGWWGK